MPRDLIGLGNFDGFKSRFRASEVLAWTAATRSRLAPAAGVLNPLPRDIGVLRAKGLPGFKFEVRIMLCFPFHQGGNMDRIVELYRGYTLQSHALQQRDSSGKWSGSFVITKGATEIARRAVAGPLDSESEAAENAQRMARAHVDEIEG
jgi:hypothetical protein